MNSLPVDVLLLLTEHLDTISIINLSRVNKRTYYIRTKVKFWLNLLQTFWNDVTIRNSDNSFFSVDTIKSIVLNAYKHWLSGTHISKHSNFALFDPKKVVDYHSSQHNGRGIFFLTRGPVFQFENPYETIYIKGVHYRLANEELIIEPDSHYNRFMPYFVGDMLVQRKRIKQLSKHTSSIMTIESWAPHLRSISDTLVLNVNLKSSLYKQVNQGVVPHPDFTAGVKCSMIVRWPLIGPMVIKVRKLEHHDYYDVLLFPQRNVQLVYEVKYIDESGTPKYSLMKCEHSSAK